MQRSALRRSRRELSNEYLLAKFGLGLFSFLFLREGLLDLACLLALLFANKYQRERVLFYIFYSILVVLLLVYWKNQVRCTLVARGYLGLFSFFFSSRRTGRPCLLACFDTAENEPCKVCPLSTYRSLRFDDRSDGFFHLFVSLSNCSFKSGSIAEFAS